VLQYDSRYINVEQWGKPALSKRPSRKSRNETKPVELFKLHLGKLQENLKPNLPIEYKKVITDYLCEFGKVKKFICFNAFNWKFALYEIVPNYLNINHF